MGSCARKRADMHVTNNNMMWRQKFTNCTKLNAFFIRVYSIRMLKMKSGNKLRMFEEYAHLEFLLTKFKVYFFKDIHVF